MFQFVARVGAIDTVAGETLLISIVRFYELTLYKTVDKCVALYMMKCTCYIYTSVIKIESLLRRIIKGLKYKICTKM